MEWLLKMRREINLYGYLLFRQVCIKTEIGIVITGLSGYTSHPDTLPAGVAGQTANVEATGGYYIGRYILGLSGGYLTKKGVNVARFDSHKQGDIISACKSVVNTSYAKSTIVTGAAWDTMLVFINGKRHGSGKNIDVFVRNTFNYPSGSATGTNYVTRIFFSGRCC